MQNPGNNLTPLDQLLAQAQDQTHHDQPEDVAAQYQQLLQTAPPEVIEQAHADAFAQLSGEERRSIAASLRAANDDPGQPFQYPGFTGDDGDADPARLAAMFSQAQRQQPDLLGGTFGLSGGRGGATNPIMQLVLSGVAALVMRKLLGGNASQNTGQLGGGGGLADILGQILGGTGGAGGSGGGLGLPSGQAGRQGGGMSSLDDLLNQQRGHSGTSAQPSGGSGGLGDLLGQLGAGGGGGGLGAILGQLAGSLGQPGNNQDDAAPESPRGRRTSR
jgi:hypothetical protein